MRLGRVERQGFIRAGVETENASAPERTPEPRANWSPNRGTLQASSDAQHVYHKQPFVKLQSMPDHYVALELSWLGRTQPMQDSRFETQIASLCGRRSQRNFTIMSERLPGTIMTVSGGLCGPLPMMPNVTSLHHSMRLDPILQNHGTLRASTAFSFMPKSEKPKIIRIDQCCRNDCEMYASSSRNQVLEILIVDARVG